jgi:hypothetical protein
LLRWCNDDDDDDNNNNNKRNRSRVSSWSVGFLRNRGKAPLILNFGTNCGWLVTFRLGWPHWKLWQRGNPAPTGAFTSPLAHFLFFFVVSKMH